MGSITCKFGGTSLADAACIRKAQRIILADDQRRFIVPSAPGKRSDGEKKITDVFYGWYHLLCDDLDPKQPIDIITQRFTALARELDVRMDVEAEIDAIANEAQHCESADYLLSRGEYLNARIISDLLDATFVDPVECIKFDYEGCVEPETYALLGERLSGNGRFVVPGYYGVDPKGRVKTFGRGGSDVTGAIVAVASDSQLYENWTDVSGFRMTDPRIVPHARRIEEITYAELRELAYMGASVLHDEAIFPVRGHKIPINIRNTNDPNNPGTMIVAERTALHPVRGIAARNGFTMINMEKAMMNKEIGFGRRALSVLEEHGVGFEHMPTGIDTLSLIIKDESLEDKGEVIVKALERTCEPDRITLSPGLALIATVGQGMNHHIGVASRLCAALSEAGVNLRVIDQGSSEMNIIVGVEAADLETAVTAIYEAFDMEE